jgi:hypothetical protein
VQNYLCEYHVKSRNSFDIARVFERL